jgi:hypothetical protein
MASALDIAQRSGTNNELTDAHRQMLTAAGHHEMDIGPGSGQPKKSR